MGLLKLLRSLEGGTKVQQIIIGYFVAPISIVIVVVVAVVVLAQQRDQL